MPGNKKSKGLGLESDEESPVPIGRTKVFAIAINKYQHEDVWPSLQYPVSDCGKLLSVLERDYGINPTADFLVDPIFDEKATADDILNELVKLRYVTGAKNRVETNDNLIIIFSGHGRIDRDLGTYYWVLSDARSSNYTELRKTGLNVDELVRIINTIGAKNILVVIDACYPQNFIQNPIVPPEAVRKGEGQPPSRFVLTAGRDEKVPDKSFFAETFIDLLQANRKPQLDLKRIEVELEEAALEGGWPKPFCYNLVDAAAQGGSFVFTRCQKQKKVASPVTPAIDINALAKGSELYHQKLKDNRFKHLRIESLLLAEPDLPDMHAPFVMSENKTSPLFNTVKSLRSKPQNNTLLIGHGGMGKTVSLVQLWDEQLRRPDEPTPVFIALNEYNDEQTEEGKQQFVKKYVAKNYLNIPNPSQKEYEQIHNLLCKQDGDSITQVSLLLDGYNEITVDNKGLLMELQEIGNSPAIQLITSSRHFEIKDLAWARESHSLDLVPLDQKAIAAYLQQTGIPMPDNEALQALLANPMMLTIYAGTCNLAIAFGEDPRFKFLTVSSEAELLWNFQEAQLAKKFQDVDKESGYNLERFLFHYFLPYLGWRMEKAGKFFITDRIAHDTSFNFPALVIDGLSFFKPLLMANELPDLEGKVILESLSMETKQDTLDMATQMDLVHAIRTKLVYQLQLLVAEGEELRFLHQHFRDYYSALHLHNCIQFAQRTAELPPAWKERVFPNYVRSMIGHLEGEHLYDAANLLAGKPLPRRIAENRIIALLNRCRKMNMDDDYTVFNLLSIYLETRGTLAGLDLSHIDATAFPFSGVSLSIASGEHTLAVGLRQTRLNANQFYSFGHKLSVNSAVYSSDSSRILSTSRDGVIKEWDLATGLCSTIFIDDDENDLVKKKVNHVWANSAVYSNDENFILIALSDNTIREWDKQNNRYTHIYKAHREGVNSAVYTPDGKFILSASDDGTIKLLNRELEKCERTFLHLDMQVISAQFNADGRKILFTSRDGIIRELDLATSSFSVKISTHNYGLINVRGYCKVTELLSAFFDDSMTLLNLNTGTETDTVNLNYHVNSVMFSADGGRILCANEYWQVVEYDLFKGVQLAIFNCNAKGLKFAIYSPDGSRVLSGWEDGTISEWERETGICLHSFDRYKVGVNSIELSSDGSRILSGTAAGIVTEWDRVTGISLRSLFGHTDCVNSAKFSDDNSRLLSASNDGTIKEWDYMKGTCLETFRYHGGWVHSAIYSPDGKFILSTSWNPTINEFNRQTRAKTPGFNEHADDVYSAVYSTGGLRILSASNDGAVIEWDRKSGARLQEYYDKDNRAEVYSAIYNADEKRILSAQKNGVIIEWDRQKCKPENYYKDNNCAVYSAIYSMDGNVILSSSEDGTIKEWNRKTCSVLRTYEGHFGPVYDAIYSKDGRRMFSASADGTVREWDTEFGVPVSVFTNEPGFLFHGVDFRGLHPESKFSEKDKERMRRFGAIFSDEEATQWKDALHRAYHKS